MTISEYYLLPEEAQKTVRLYISEHSIYSLVDVEYTLNNACRAIELKLDWRLVFLTTLTAEAMLRYLKD